MGHGRVRAFVGLGGNVGGEDAVCERFDAATAAIAALPGVTSVRRASRYQTRPVGPVQQQPPFTNSAALVILRGLRPVDFLRELLAIEARLGRDRTRELRLGPRPIDLDLLLWDGLVLVDPGPPPLELPHPRLVARAFALAPLVELGGEDLLVPGPRGGRAGDLLASALADPAQHVEKRPEPGAP
jgi:2-amino-4-hydroxy-6-hydroxymethyldihydropteridine diphosphokinase